MLQWREALFWNQKRLTFVLLPMKTCEKQGIWSLCPNLDYTWKETMAECWICSFWIILLRVWVLGMRLPQKEVMLHRRWCPNDTSGFPRLSLHPSSSDFFIVIQFLPLIQSSVYGEPFWQSLPILSPSSWIFSNTHPRFFLVRTKISKDFQFKNVDFQFKSLEILNLSFPKISILPVISKWDRNAEVWSLAALSSFMVLMQHQRLAEAGLHGLHGCCLACWERWF